MATAAVQRPVDANNQASTYREPYAVTTTSEQKIEKHDVQTILNFFKANDDGSPPLPTYVNQPETYERPFETHNVTIQDVTGDEARYSLDSHGFQFVPHVSKERDFVDDAQIKDQYYKEVDQILRNAQVQIFPASIICVLNVDQNWSHSNIHLRPHNQASHQRLS